MKSTFTPNQLRLIGKAWEVRHLLRVLVSQANDRHTPLKELLDRRQHALAPDDRRSRVSYHATHTTKTERRVVPFPLS